jgi:hypothetical protein
MEQENHVLSKFRNLLNQFKRPYIEMTNAPAPASPDITQDVGKLNDIFENIHNLYMLLKPILVSGGKVPESLQADADTMEIVAVFEKEGILPALRASPSLKDSMLRFLKLDLETYPYTLNPGHIKVLAEHTTESHQGAIVGNKTDE